MKERKFIIVFVTASSNSEAEKIANALVDKKLAACVNIVPNIKSIYIWEGKKEQADEFLLIIKSRKANFKKIIDAVKAVHTYTVPEIISLPITDGNPKYLEWIATITDG